jgi:TDG/mug DNA glycosylase family protein
MPSVKSLAAAQYYAHPQNRFWPLIARLCHEAAAPDSYAARLSLLKDNGFALWDVLKLCRRQGSLDSAITDEEPNDVSRLLSDYPAIKTVAFNGTKAYASFKKHFPQILADNSYRFVRLPSTSPANASWRFDALFKDWSEKLFG